MGGCAAFKCTNSSDKNETKKLSFVRFPKDKRLFEIWTRACGNLKVTHNSRLCTEHFESDQFIRALHNTKLLDYAVPTLFAFKNDSPKKIMFTSPMNEITPIKVPRDDAVKRIFSFNEFDTTKSIEINNITPSITPLRAPRSIFFSIFY